MPDTYTLLEKVVVGAANATTVTFTSIPQTYTDLVLMCTIRTTGGIQAIDFRFNNDTGSNYSWRYAQGTGTGIDPGTGSGQTVFSEAMVANGSASTANNFSNSTLYIPNYTSSSNKSFSLDTVEEENASNAYSRLESGAWNNTAAITSINLSASGDFVQYSTFYLYGIAKLGVTPTSAPKATGGDRIVTDGTYWYHAFTSSGTFRPSTSLSCDVLVVAGGGGGGMQQAGGGGAGGVFYATSQGFTNTNYTVTVGSGGSRSTVNNAPGSNGSNSVFGSLTAAVGGGGGGSRFDTNGSSPGVGQNGGSGGGGGYTGAGGTGTAGQGNNGATGNTSGGGGGGAGAVGGNLAGGAGTNTYSAFASATSTGVSNYYAGGGGGGGWTTTGGTGGSGGGGNGGYPGQPTAGTANTGGGGGGGYYDGSSPTNYYGANGGSGIVIVRYAV